MPKLVVSSNGSPATAKRLPEIEDVLPLPHLVYVEMFSPQECIGTSLELMGKTEVTVNEGRVLAIGSRVPDIGVKVGDRVFVNGSIVFGPNYQDYRWTEEGRKRGMISPNTIYGVIKEKSNLS